MHQEITKNTPPLITLGKLLNSEFFLKQKSPSCPNFNGPMLESRTKFGAKFSKDQYQKLWEVLNLLGFSVFATAMLDRERGADRRHIEYKFENGIPTVMTAIEILRSNKNGVAPFLWDPKYHRDFVALREQRVKELEEEEKQSNDEINKFMATGSPDHFLCFCHLTDIGGFR